MNRHTMIELQELKRQRLKDRVEDSEEVKITENSDDTSPEGKATLEMLDIFSHLSEALNLTDYKIKGIAKSIFPHHSKFVLWLIDDFIERLEDMSEFVSRIEGEK